MTPEQMNGRYSWLLAEGENFDAGFWSKPQSTEEMRVAAW